MRRGRNTGAPNRWTCEGVRDGAGIVWSRHQTALYLHPLVLRATLAILCVVVGSVSPFGRALADGPIKRTVGAQWTWLTDYIYFSADWTIKVQSECEVEVGTGISFKGKPRGSRWRVRGNAQFTTYGMGAIHVRATNGNVECAIRLDQGDVGAITVFSTSY